MLERVFFFHLRIRIAPLFFTKRSGVFEWRAGFAAILTAVWTAIGTARWDCSLELLAGTAIGTAVWGNTR